MALIPQPSPNEQVNRRLKEQVLLDEALQTPWNNRNTIEREVEKQKENVVAILSYDQFPFMEGVTLVVRWDVDQQVMGAGIWTLQGLMMTVHPWPFVKMVGELMGYDQAVAMLRLMIKSRPDRIQAALEGLDVLKWLTHQYIELLFRKHELAIKLRDRMKQFIGQELNDESRSAIKKTIFDGIFEPHSK